MFQRNSIEIPVSGFVLSVFLVFIAVGLALLVIKAAFAGDLLMISVLAGISIFLLVFFVFVMKWP